MTPINRVTTSGASFRRRRFQAPRRRRSLALLLLKPFLGALALVSIPAAAAGWILTSPRFLLHELLISGTERVSRSWVAERLEPLQGRHLFRVSLPQIQEQLRGNPWLDTVETRKELPDRLLVTVSERRPEALLRREDGLYFVDGRGRVIERAPVVGESLDFPLLAASDASGEELVTALQVVRRLRELEPDWARELSEIEALRHGDYRLFTAALPFALLIHAGRLEKGLRDLRSHLPGILRHFPGAVSVDVRFENQIVIHPAASPHNLEG